VVLGGVWVEVVALVAAFAIAVVTTPARVSGAVLLLPFQVRVLGTSGPSVTPTNLLYNVVACPGALWRYRRQGQTGGTLTRLLLAGTVPGVIAGSVIRVYVLPGPEVFELVIGAVLLPLGALLALTRTGPAASHGCRRWWSRWSRVVSAASTASAAGRSWPQIGATLLIAALGAAALTGFWALSHHHGRGPSRGRPSVS
jgi:uncharacterized protein